MGTRITGKNGKILLNTGKTLVSAEGATLNATAETVGGVSYAAYRVATLTQKFVIPDSVDSPLTVVLAIGTGSAIPEGISYIVDYNLGKIIFDTALTALNTVTVTYYHASGFVEVADMNNWAIDERVDEVETTSFNDEWKDFRPMQKSWDGSVDGHFNMYLYREAVGNDDSASYTVPALMVYVKFYVNRNAAVGTGNPYFAGAALMSTSIKTPATGKVEFSAKLKGVGGLAQFVS